MTSGKNELQDNRNFVREVENEIPENQERYAKYRKEHSQIPEVKAAKVQHGKEYIRMTTPRFKSAINGAKNAHHTWSLTQSEWESYISPICGYCHGPSNKTGSGLDRMDNDKGYEVGNVISCCMRCNRMKGKFLTYSEMMLIWDNRRQQALSTYLDLDL